MALQLFRKEITSVHQAAFLLGAAGFLSRLLGILRDRMLASTFGATRTLDVYYASFQIPDFLFSVFLIGAASAAILPAFLAYQEESDEKARSFIGGLILLFSAGSILIAAVAAIFAPWLVRVIAPGFGGEAKALMVTMTRIMMLSPIFLGISNIFSSVVQAQRKFFVFALTSIVYNLGIITGILLFIPRFGTIGLAWGVVVGAFLHMAIQGIPLFSSGFRPIWRGIKHLSGITRVFLLSIPRVIALSLNQIMLATLVALGSFLSAGNIAVFQFSNNLRYLPIGIIGVSYAVAVFPKLTTAVVKKSKETFYGDLASMIETILFWVVPIAFLSIVLRAHIVRLALGGHAFTWTDTRLTAAAFAIFAITIISESLTPLILRSFYALGNTRLPLLVSLFTAVLVMSSAPLFVSLFVTQRKSSHFIANLMKVGDISSPGVLGLALAFTLGNVMDLILLSFALSSEAKRYFGGGVITNGIFAAVFRTAFASLLAALLGYGVLFLTAPHIPLTTFWNVFLQAAITFICSAAFYFLVMYVLGSDEMKSIFTAIHTRFIGAKVLPQNIEDHQEPPLT